MPGWACSLGNWAGAPVELSGGGRGFLATTAESASEDKWVRTSEADTTGAKGGLWRVKAGLGKFSEVIKAFKRPYSGPRGSKGQGFPTTEAAASTCTIGMVVQGGRVVGLAGASKQREGLQGRIYLPATTPRAGAPLDLSGERERRAATVDPASEGRWVRKNV